MKDEKEIRERMELLLEETILAPNEKAELQTLEWVLEQ